MTEECIFNDDFVKSNQIDGISLLKEGDSFHPLFGCESVVLTKDELLALILGAGILIPVEQEYTILLTREKSNDSIF